MVPASAMMNMDQENQEHAGNQENHQAHDLIKET